jgi:hypothetical protein
VAVLDLNQVKAEIEAVILEYEGRRISIDAEKRKLTRGKLYELFVLGRVISELKSRGFRFSFVGKVLSLKQAPGKIQPSDGYFLGHHPGSSHLPFRLYTDLEVRTLGSLHSSTTDDSAYHEIDIVAVDEGVSGNPTPDDLLLGVECKSTAKFTKSIVKETLGIKREISLLCGDQPSRLALLACKSTPEVPSQPPVEYWLVYCDPKGNSYRESPKTFGIEYREWRP